MTQDPIVRYVAGLILVLAFAGAGAVVVHGYWLDAGYQPPQLVGGAIGSVIAACLVLLGVHVGNTGTQTAMSATSKVVTEQKNGNGKPPAGGGVH